MIAQSKIDDLGIFDTSQLIAAMRQHSLGIGTVPSGSRISLALAVIAWYDRIQKSLAENSEVPSRVVIVSADELRTIIRKSILP